MNLFYKEIFDNNNLDILNKYTLVFVNEITGNIDSDLLLLNSINNNTGKKVLLMYDNEPIWHGEDYFIKLYKHNKNVYLSSANLDNIWSPHPNIVYFPLFYFTQLNHKNYQSTPKEFRFSFLSNKPKFHRIYFYYTVKSNIDVNNDCFSVNNEAFGRKWYKERYIMEMKNELGYYNIEMEKSLPYATINAIECNRRLNTIGNHSSDTSNKHVAYNSCFNIVGESDNNPFRVFVTEKTWKVVRSKVSPIFLDSDLMFNAFQRLGFLFENEINLSGISYVDKVAHINEYMRDYTMDSIVSIYNDQYSAIEHNYNRFHSEDLKNIFVNHIRDKLKI